MKEITPKLIEYYKNSWIRWLVIPSIFLIFYIIFSLLFNSYVNFTTLVQNYNQSNFIQIPKGKLLQNNIVSGEFTASDNNLGIVSIGFLGSEKKVSYDDEDVLIFKIKEKGQNQLWYSGKFRSGAISGEPIYPFGFPVISKSKGKIYQFSIISLHGNKQNAVSLSMHEPILTAWYVYPKHELLSNKKLLLIFLYKKLIDSFTNLYFLNASFTYSLPLVLYLFALIFITKMRIDRYSFILVVPILIILSVIWNIDTNSGLFFELIGFWIIILIAYDAESNISILFALFFFILAFLLVIFNNQNMAARFSNWTYVYLVIGTVQLLLEYKKHKQKKLTWKILFNNMLHNK